LAELFPGAGAGPGCRRRTIPRGGAAPGPFLDVHQSAAPLRRCSLQRSAGGGEVKEERGQGKRPGRSGDDRRPKNDSVSNVGKGQGRTEGSEKDETDKTTEGDASGTGRARGSRQPVRRAYEELRNQRKWWDFERCGADRSIVAEHNGCGRSVQERYGFFVVESTRTSSRCRSCCWTC